MTSKVDQTRSIDAMSVRPEPRRMPPRERFLEHRIARPVAVGETQAAVGGRHLLVIR